MDYVKKTQQLEEHIKENPTDYQAVIAHLKTRSKAIEHEKRMKMANRIAKVAEYRSKLNEQESVIK